MIIANAQIKWKGATGLSHTHKFTIEDFMTFDDVREIIKEQPIPDVRNVKFICEFDEYYLSLK